MYIPCPWCGDRDFEEFVYGGDATVERPVAPNDISLDEWTDYLYIRDNPEGDHDELWFHAYGCNGWFLLRRNTVTHEVSAATAPRTTASGLAYE